MGFQFHQGYYIATYIKPCNANDPELNKCFAEHAKEAVPFLVKGDKKYNVHALDPLFLERVDLRPNNQIILKLQKVKILGLGGLKIKEANVDLKKRHIKLTMSVSKLDVFAQYNMSGQIRVIPIHGQGPMEIKFTDANLVYAFDYNLEVRKDSKTYLGDIKPSIDFQVKSAHFLFGNLFDGNKQISDSTHEVLNKNWQDVMNIFGDPIAECIQEIATTLIKALLYPVSFDKIFSTN
ncbi:unnamed protein product [Ceutorhynchus assimilis]|uniref:Uncharacterized protein n=1 Tax=Ceutorhynchus assimilis TaxID=467358 RepID=A0A9P0DCW5_9CUCU|nr:unnamed protein product [Ceutorhynchus assimilis]